jgi:hypothetical protein
MKAMELTELFANLRSGAMSAAEYRLNVQAGRLARWTPDDEPFEADNPENPQAHTNRSRRIEASDRIRRLAQTDPKLFVGFQKH